MNLKNAYLAYQADIGTDEVILPYPWIRKTASPVVSAPPLRASRLSPTPVEGPEFFQAMAQALKTNGPMASKSPKVATAPFEAAPIAEFKDLNAYWDHLATEVPRWFSTASSLAKSEGLPHAALAVVELWPSSETGVFRGAAGDLLDKMMKAIHWDRGRLYLTSVMKTPPPGKSWARKDVARMLPFFYQELRLAAPSSVLLLGEACAQAVLRTGLSLEALRQKPFEAEGSVFSASFHPSELESGSAEQITERKRKTWDDLKWLRTRLESGAR